MTMLLMLVFVVVIVGGVEKLEPQQHRVVPAIGAAEVSPRMGLECKVEREWRWVPMKTS